MPNIPGQQRLGMGFPGGAAAIPGAVRGLPTPGLPSSIPGLPRIGAMPDAAPLPTFGTPSPRFQQDDSVVHAKALRLTQAQEILNQVRHRRISPERARAMLVQLPDEERHHLWDAELRDAQTHGGDIRPIAKALDVESMSRSAVSRGQQDLPGPKVLTNLSRDISTGITGMPAGLMLAGKAAGLDISEAVTGKKEQHHLLHDVGAPLAKQYAHTYGPALRGDYGETAHRIGEHPLGPVLDVASLVSAGIGTTARVGAALDAVRAGQLVRIPGEGVIKIGDKPLVAAKGIKVEPLVEGDRLKVLREVRASEWKDPMAQNLAQGALINGTMGKIYLARDARTGKLLGISRHEHGNHISGDETDTSTMLHQIASTGEKPGTGSTLLRAIADEAHGAGKTHINLQSTHSAEEFYKNRGFEEMMPGQDAGYFTGDVTKDPTFKTRVGGQYTVHTHAPKLKPPPEGGWVKDELGIPIRDWDPRTLSNQNFNLGEDFVAVSAAVDRQTGKIYSSTRDHTEIIDDLPRDIPIDRLDQYTVIVDREGKVHAVNGKNEMMRDSGHAADKDVAEAIKNQVEDKTRRAKALPRGPSPEELKAAPYLNRFPVAIHRQTGKLHVGEMGEEHYDLHDALGHGLETPAAEYHHGTGIFDPETGRVARINMTAFEDRVNSLKENGFDERAQSLGDEYAAMSERALNAARLKFDPPKTVSKTTKYSVRDAKGRIIAQNFPDEKSAIAHAQSLISPTGTNPLRAATSPGARGSLIDAYERKRGIDHADEEAQIADEIQSVLEDDKVTDAPKDPAAKRVRQSFRQVVADVKATREFGKGKPFVHAQQLPSFVSKDGSRVLGRSLGVAGTALREVSDLVRAGAIYLRPAYLPNNWAGNSFMNIVHQGFLAPINLGKSMVMDQYIGRRYTAAIDKGLGMNPAEVVAGSSRRGYVASITHPAAHVMGMIADQPFRRAAWLHEARRAGYNNLGKVKGLLEKVDAGDERAMREMASISRKAQEEIVKFGHMNDIEQSVIRNLFFVYSWVRGAGRYSARFPMQHPIQSAAYMAQGQQGAEYLKKEMGGVPQFLVGAIPVGHDKDGNPIIINPFSLNPLGTGLDVLRAAAGTAQIAAPIAKSLVMGKQPNLHPFNKFAQQDLVNLTNPLVQSYIGQREGQPADLRNSIAPVRLVHELKHPGSGSLFPTSRKEAVGKFGLGTLFPRMADQGAITRSLEREHQDDPASLIPHELKQYKKITGETLPPQLVGEYKADLELVDELKKFQSDYATHHGQSGFKNLPPKNQAEAAINFVDKYKYAHKDEVAEFRRDMSEIQDDAEYREFANEIWGMTGIGEVKREWQSLMREAKGMRLSRERK